MTSMWHKIIGLMTNTLFQAAICWLSIMAMLMIVTSDFWMLFFSGCLVALGLIQSVRIHLLEKELLRTESARNRLRRKSPKGKR